MPESKSPSDRSVRRFSLLLPLACFALLLPWACRERVLDVLGPLPSNAPSAARAGAAGILDAGTTVPDSGTQFGASCEQGLELGASCSSSRECCSGYCGASGASGELRCLASIGCGTIDQSCTTAGECCSLACAPRQDQLVCSD